jgi:hypothetical protein
LRAQRSSRTRCGRARIELLRGAGGRRHRQEAGAMTQAAKKVRDQDLVEPLDPEAKAPLGGPTAHPVGAGVGMVGGTVAGAAVGSVVAPGIGTVVGAAVGAVTGAFVGKGVAEAIDPVQEDAYWQSAYTGRPYHDPTVGYDDLRPAYRYGWESRARHPERSFDEVEQDLGAGWVKERGSSRLEWDRAKHAARDAWHRVERKLPGDADNDGR